MIILDDYGWGIFLHLIDVNGFVESGQQHLSLGNLVVCLW